MNTKSQITIRSKKLGILIRDARLAARRSVEECAEVLGIRKILFCAYEEGIRSPSLPELETLVYFLDLPMDHFWGKQSKFEQAPQYENLDRQRLLAVRQRKIGALLRQERMNASISLRQLEHATSIPSERIEAYELGERPIPLPELELLVKTLGGRIEAFFDRSSPIGQWMINEEAIQHFLEMPMELRQFVTLAVNRPYLEVARKLSAMSKEKLRAVAEDLLEITL